MTANNPASSDQTLLRVTEIYPSVQGESSFAGKPCSFVRLTGCPLRCRWCDTAYGFEGGEDLAIADIITRLKHYGLKLVELTGGEPLAQAAANSLMATLINEGFELLLETGGSEDIKGVPPQTHIILDIKCPDSRMAHRNLWSNLGLLKPTDEIKFVVASKADYQWAKQIIAKHDLDQRFQVLVSPAYGLIQPKDLSSWIVEDKLNVRLNLQLHKFIWSPRAKGV